MCSALCDKTFRTQPSNPANGVLKKSENVVCVAIKVTLPETFVKIIVPGYFWNFPGIKN